MNLARMASQRVQGVLRSAVAGPEASAPVGQRSVAKPLMADAWPAHRSAPVSVLLSEDVGLWSSGSTLSNGVLGVGLLNHQRLPETTPLVAILSKSGVARVRRETAQAFDALTRSYDDKVSHAPGTASVQATLAASLDLAGGDVAQVWVPRARYRGFMAAYRQGVAEGKLPASFGQVPYTEFFRPTDDVRAELQAWQLSRSSSRFANRGKEEQRVVAALAHRMAGQGPKAVPYALRLALSEALIRHERIGGPASRHAASWRELASRDGLSAMPFHHGTRDAHAIVQEGFRPGDNQLMGPGIYYGNASVAAQYANRGDGARARDMEQIVSGLVLPGKTVPEKLDVAGMADSAVSPQPIEGGAYWVTRDPQRFQIRAVTTHDRSAAATQLKPFVPDLFGTLALGPEAQQWALDWLGGINRSALNREAMRLIGDDATGMGAGIWFIQQGHEIGVAQLKRVLESAASPQARLSAASAALDGLAQAPPERRLAMLKLLRSTDPDLQRALIMARKNHPETLVMARELLRQSDHPAARERLLSALRRAENLTPPNVRESLASLDPLARAEIYFELGRQSDGLRELLADAATLAGERELGIRAASLLLRRSAMLDDTDWRRWRGFVRERDPDGYARLVVDGVAQDGRFLDDAIAVLKRDQSSWASQRAMGLLKQAAVQDALLPFAKAVLASDLSDDFKVLAAEALSRPNSGMKV